MSLAISSEPVAQIYKEPVVQIKNESRRDSVERNESKSNLAKCQEIETVELERRLVVAVVCQEFEPSCFVWL